MNRQPSVVSYSVPVPFLPASYGLLSFSNQVSNCLLRLFPGPSVVLEKEKHQGLSDVILVFQECTI